MYFLNSGIHKSFHKVTETNVYFMEAKKDIDLYLCAFWAQSSTVQYHYDSSWTV